MRHENVYGSNDEADDKTTGEQLEEIRQRQGGAGGGMGREETPKDSSEQGAWTETSDAVQQDETELHADMHPRD